MIEEILHIENSQITNKKAVSKFFQQHKDGKYMLTSKRMNKRSLQFNKYYWKCVVGAIKDRMIELGNDVDSELVHSFLKDRFNPKELFTKDGTVIGTVGDTTTEMNNEEFDNYIEKIKHFAAEALGIYVADPNQQSKLQLA